MSFPNGETSSLLEFDADHARQCVVLSVVDDTECERKETVVLTLDVECMTQPFYLVVQPSFLNIKIVDNDGEFELGSW